MNNDFCTKHSLSFFKGELRNPQRRCHHHKGRGERRRARPGAAPRASVSPPARRRSVAPRHPCRPRASRAGRAGLSTVAGSPALARTQEARTALPRASQRRLGTGLGTCAPSRLQGTGPRPPPHVALCGRGAARPGSLERGRRPRMGASAPWWPEGTAAATRPGHCGAGLRLSQVPASPAPPRDARITRHQATEQTTLAMVSGRALDSGVRSGH